MSERSPSRTRLLLAVLAIAGIFILAVPTTAQTLYGSVVGLAKDAQGAVLPGATVTLVNSGTGLKRDTVTDAQGGYNFVNVLAGTYDVRVAMSGFRESVRTGVPVSVGQISRVDMTLEIGAMNETVSVMSDVPAAPDRQGRRAYGAQVRGDYQPAAERLPELPGARGAGARLPAADIAERRN